MEKEEIIASAPSDVLLAEAEELKNKDLDGVEDGRSQVYELGYLIVSFIPAEGLEKEIENIRNIFVKHGATIIKEGAPKFMLLAYEMSKNINNKKQKFNEAYFGWIKFEMNSLESAACKEALKKYDNLLRFLVIKTVKEDTFVTRRVIRSFERTDRGSERTSAHHEELEVSTKAKEPEMSKEDIDKKIEELVG